MLSIGKKTLTKIINQNKLFDRLKYTKNRKDIIQQASYGSLFSRPSRMAVLSFRGDGEINVMYTLKILLHHIPH